MAARESLPFLLIAAASAPAFAADCFRASPLDQNSVPLTVTQADAVPGSVTDGLLVRAGGALSTVRVEVRVGAGRGTEAIETREKLVLEEVHVGPLLPSSGFPVLWIDETTGDAVHVRDGDELPLEKVRVAERPETIRVTLSVAGAGGGFARDVPVPLIVLGFTGSVGELEIRQFQAFGPDGAELTAVFEVGDLCVRPECEPRILQKPSFDVDLQVSLPETEPDSVPEGVLLQPAGEVQSGDFELFFDPRKLVLAGVKIGPYFVRDGCPVAFAPAFGPGEIVADLNASIAPRRVLKEPGHILFGLASVGLCPPAPPAAGSAQGIAKLSFGLHPDLSLLHDIDMGIETAQGTRLFGSDGAPEVTFFRRVGACYRFRGLCATTLTCVLTPDCLGTVCTWDNAAYDSVRVFRDGLFLKNASGGAGGVATDPVVVPGPHRYGIVGRLKGIDCELAEASITIPFPLVCPTGFHCEDYSELEDGQVAIGLTWTNGQAYDALEVRADERLVAVAGPEATSVRIVVDPRVDPVPTRFTIVAASGGKSCQPLACTPLPVCLMDMTCSLDTVGHVRLDWGGSPASVTVRSVDVASGAETLLADRTQGLASFTDSRNLGPQGTRYYVTAFPLESEQGCGFGYCVVGAKDFIRGDFNADGTPNLSDVIASLRLLFSAGPAPACEASADVNGDFVIDVSDPIRQVIHDFAGGPPPPGPFPSCGPDATDSALGCASFPPCPGDAAFPGVLTCTLDAARANVRVSWSGGAGIESLTVRLGSGMRQALSPSTHSATVAIPADAYGRSLPVILEAELESGGRRARSCEVALPAAAVCPGDLALAADAAAGVIAVSWSPAGVAVTVRKDSGLVKTLPAGARATTFPLEAGDPGRIVAVTLTASRPFGGACPALSAQVGVPSPFACFGAPSCAVNSARGTIDVTWTAGVNLPDLEIQKGDAEPVGLDPAASSAAVPIAAADLGKSVVVTLRTSSPGCPERSCTAQVPPAQVSCMTGLACGVDVHAGVIRAAWQPAANLASLEIEKDGARVASVPPDAEGFNVLIVESDRGRDVKLTLRGRDALGAEVCSAQCTATVPPPPVTLCDPAETLIPPADVVRSNGGPGSTSAVEVYSCRLSLAEPGPERAFRLLAGTTEKLLCRFTELTTNLDLFILDGDAAPCDGSRCIAAATATGTDDLEFVLPVEAGKTYFLVVDSPGGVGSFRLQVEELFQGPCQAARSLFCGAITGGSNADSGSTNQRLTYSCAPFDLWTGPELTYIYSSSQPQSVTVDLSGLGADLDLFVLQDQGTGCDGDACIASSLNSGVSQEQVRFTAAGGRNYFVVVDGFDHAVSSYQIHVSCAPAQPRFIRGDANGDGKLDISDGNYILQVAHGQLTPQCADACDVDDDGAITDQDRTVLFNYLFFGGAPPPPPGITCGVDPTPDPLGCVTPPTGCNP